MSSDEGAPHRSALAYPVSQLTHETGIIDRSSGMLPIAVSSVGVRLHGEVVAEGPHPVDEGAGGGVGGGGVGGVGGNDALMVLQLSVEHVLHCQSEMPVTP